MIYTMITKYHNYDYGYITLVNLKLNNLPTDISVNGYKLYIKDEFHISIMALQNLARLIDASNIEAVEAELKNDFLEFVTINPLNTYNLNDEFRLVKRGKRATLVAMVDLPGVEDLFSRLRKNYSVDLPTQPTHITLYTLQPNRGIGILSQEEVDRESAKVDVPKLNGISR